MIILMGTLAIAVAIALLLSVGDSPQNHRASHRRPQGPLIPAGCDLLAGPSTFDAQLFAAAKGQTICLASGDYERWTGTTKPVTITAAPGAAPRMTIAFAAEAAHFTLTHMAALSGTITGGASDIKIVDNVMSDTACAEGCLSLTGAVRNIVVADNDFSYSVASVTGGPNSKIFLDTTGSSPGAAATIKNNTIANGDLDGIHLGGSGDLITGNRLSNLCDRGINHTDNIQFEGGSQITVEGNYLYEAQDCPTQGITSYDGGTNGLLIEDNVVDVPRDWGIELYSDQNSIVTHNTVVYHPKSYSEFNTGTGQIDIDRKSQDPAGTGTRVYDNIATTGFTNGSTGTASHNTDPSTVTYTGGPPTPTSTYANLFLTPTSPGHAAATDGQDTGIQHTLP